MTACTFLAVQWRRCNLRDQHRTYGRYKSVGQVMIAQEDVEVVLVMRAKQVTIFDAQEAACKCACMAVTFLAALIPIVVKIDAGYGSL